MSRIDDFPSLALDALNPDQQVTAIAIAKAPVRIFFIFIMNNLS